MPAIPFHPLYQSRVWGGRTLAERFGRTLPQGQPIGESWELVDRPEAQSIVAEGPYAGLTLRQLIEQHGQQILSQGYDCKKSFPLLIKWLDCQQRLSLQVHPPAHIAPSLGGQPKTEAWYIAHAQPGAGVYAGLRAGTTRATFEAALASSTLEKKDLLQPLCHRLPTHTGDCMFIPSGRLHAIDAGNLILEVQQNSDTTYRVYDWGRPRQLHIAQSLACIDFTDYQPNLSLPTPTSQGQLLCKSSLFTLYRHHTPQPTSWSYTTGSTATILTIAQGTLGHYTAGQTLLIPREKSLILPTSEGTTIILTTDFI